MFWVLGFKKDKDLEPTTYNLINYGKTNKRGTKLVRDTHLCRL